LTNLLAAINCFGLLGDPIIQAMLGGRRRAAIAQYSTNLEYL
jgi:hypothetical protein